MKNIILINSKEVKITNMYGCFKNKWNDDELCSVKKILEKIFNGRFFTNHNNKIIKIKNYDDLDNFLGLAYTDTDRLAKLGIANGEKVYVNSNKSYYLDSFILNNNNKLLFIVINDEEEKKYYETDFNTYL